MRRFKATASGRKSMSGSVADRGDFCTFLLSPRREESECTTRSTPPQAESFKNVALNNCHARYRLKKCRVYGRKYFCKNNIKEIKKSFFVIFILFIIIKIHIREQFREKKILIATFHFNAKKFKQHLKIFLSLHCVFLSLIFVI